MTDGAPNPFPPLDAATEAALRASIQKFGVMVPIVVDPKGNVIDGRHRLAIWRAGYREVDPDSVTQTIPGVLPYIVVTDVVPTKPKGMRWSTWHDQYPNIDDLLDEFGGSQQVVPFGSEQYVVVPSYDPEEIARTLNLDRRHLTTEQRRAVVVDLRMSGGHSTRA